MLKINFKINIKGVLVHIGGIRKLQDLMEFCPSNITNPPAGLNMMVSDQNEYNVVFKLHITKMFTGLQKEGKQIQNSLNSSHFDI